MIVVVRFAPRERAYVIYCLGGWVGNTAILTELMNRIIFIRVGN